MGLAYDLKKVNDYRIARQLVLEHKDKLIQSLKDSYFAQKELFEQRIQEISEKLTAKLAELQGLLDKYKSAAPKDKTLLEQIRSMKKSLKHDWKEWREVIKTLSKDVPLKA